MSGRRVQQLRRAFRARYRHSPTRSEMRFVKREYMRARSAGAR